MALFGQDTPDPRVVAGGAALGDLIAGGPGQRAQGAYVDQYKKHGQAADAMWQARDSRARAIAREMIDADRVQRAMQGDQQAQAELAAGSLGTAPTPNLSNITGGLGDFADMEITRQRQDALTKGDVPAYNRLTALETDKAYQQTRIEDGVMMADGAALGDQVIPLPQTQATIDQRRASANATTMRADAYADSTRTRANAYADRQGRAPGKTLTAEQADVQMEWILAQANQHAAKGKPDEWVQAFIRKEAAKAGLQMEAPSVEAPAAAGSVPGEPTPIAPQGVDQQKYATALRERADALRAIADGAPPAAVAARMRQRGYAKLADDIEKGR